MLDAEGRFILSIWDGIEANDFARLVTDVAAGLFPDDPPRFLARTPHGHGDPATIERELRSAGFATVEIEMLEATSRAQSPRIRQSPMSREHRCAARSRPAMPAASAR
ncbi:MAG: hypothetical protein R3C69_06070 [Geminicoccaceae bacterium]